MRDRRSGVQRPRNRRWRATTRADRWVAAGRYPNRSQAIQAALREKSERWKRIRLIEEFARLDPAEERGMAEERFAGETWPAY